MSTPRADATREVAQDEFWQRRRLGFDVLVPGEVLGRAEAWRARAAEQTKPGGTPAVTGYGVGQRVTYRREGYTVEAVTDRYIDLYDEQNGSARVLFTSSDIHAVRVVQAESLLPPASHPGTAPDVSRFFSRFGRTDRPMA